MKKQFKSNKHGEELAQKVGWFVHRNHGQYAGAGHDGPMKTYFGSRYDWHGMVIYQYKEEDEEDITAFQTNTWKGGEEWDNLQVCQGETEKKSQNDEEKLGG